MSYPLSKIKVAAYNWEELPDMTASERALWMGLGYCYEWHKDHPQDKGECEKLAEKYIKMFYKKGGDDADIRN